MKYLILIWSNPASRKLWDSFSDADRAAGWGVYTALNEEIGATGELIASEALTDPSQAKRVGIGDPSAMLTDGPFAEVKEYLAGFYLVDCESSERAEEIGARIPEAVYGLVEVRPVLTLGGTDM